MGVEYDAMTRVKALKYSQWISTIIYLLLIAFTNPIFLKFPVTELSETTIIHVLGQALIVLPVLLLAAAVTSQLSAALADTIGGGGLLKELIQLKLSDKFFYYDRDRHRDRSDLDIACLRDHKLRLQGLRYLLSDPGHCQYQVAAKRHGHQSQSSTPVRLLLPGCCSGLCNFWIDTCPASLISVH